jgi:RNA:NAD 2'-phosphotransferase (TPT1/KptA family)
VARHPTARGDDFIILYHGTTSDRVTKIRTQGLRKGTWLSTGYRAARSYAIEKAAERHNDDPAVLKVAVPKSLARKMQESGKHGNYKLTGTVQME